MSRRAKRLEQGWRNIEPFQPRQDKPSLAGISLDIPDEWVVDILHGAFSTAIREEIESVVDRRRQKELAFAKCVLRAFEKSVRTFPDDFEDFISS